MRIARAVRRLAQRLRGLLPSVALCRATVGRRTLLVHLIETGLREHVEPVVHWLVANDDCAIVVVVPAAQVAAFRDGTSLPLGNPRLHVITDEHFLNSLVQPDVLFTLHPETRSRLADAYAGRGVFRVVMQHGLPDKEVFFVEDGRGDTLSCYDGLFLYGPESRQGSLQRYANHYPAEFRRLRIFDIGYPKTDGLAPSLEVRKEVVRSLGFPPDRPLVCYAPTYQRTASLESHGLVIIEALAALDVSVVVKLHHVSLKSPRSDLPAWVRAETDGKDWRAILTSVEAHHPNVRLAPGHDANPYLVASDVLVTDVSGVAFEFLLLDRPIVFFDVPALFDRFGRIGLHFWGRTCGELVAGVEELGPAVHAACANPRHGQDRRQELRARLMYNPGHATEVAGRTLQTLMRRP